MQHGDLSATVCSVPSLRILLIDTKVPRSTKRLVAGVRERYDKVRCDSSWQKLAANYILGV